MHRSSSEIAAPATAGKLAMALAALLLAALAGAGEARAAGVPISGGETQLALNRGLEKGLRREAVAIDPLAPTKLKGRTLALPVASGTFEAGAGGAVLAHSGGLRFVSGGRVVALRRLRLDASRKLLSANVAGRRMKVAGLVGMKVAQDGFDLRLMAKRLPLTDAATAVIDRGLRLANALRAGQSLGSVNGLGEPSAVQIDSGQIAIGGPETAFSKLESLGVQMGIWGSTQRWSAPGENYFLFSVEPTTVSPDASSGIVEGAENDGVTMEIFEPPPREMLLRHPRIDLAAHELSATLSPVSMKSPVTETIATLDYSAAKIQVRPGVGAFELMGIRAVANQFMADQLNVRFQTPGLFAAGETLARLTVNLHAR